MTNCGAVFAGINNGSLNVLPPPDQGWQPVRQLNDCPGCWYNPNNDQTWDPSDPKTWGGTLYSSTLPPDARTVLSQVAKNTSPLTTTKFWTEWTAAAAAPALVYNGPGLYAGASNAWLMIEAAHPGATAAVVDAIQVLSPVPAVPSTSLGLAVEAYNAYEWWKRRH